jgi:thiamine biosynthesis protein ThiS
MKIHIDKEKKNLELDFQGTADELLKELEINPETVVVTQNDELITLDKELKTSDKIKILSVVSGG